MLSSNATRKVIVKVASPPDQFGHAFTLKTKHLNERLTGLTFPITSGGGTAFIEAYKLEGLCLLAMHADTSVLTAGGPLHTVKLGRSRLDADSLQTALRKLDAKGYLDKAVGLEYQALCDLLKEAGARLLSESAMRVTSADLEGLEGIASDVPLLVSDETLAMGYHTPYFYSGCSLTMRVTGELILMAGPRERHADRVAADDSYQELLNAMWTHMCEQEGYKVETATAAAKLIEFVLTRTELPELITLLPATAPEGIMTFRRRTAYAVSNAVQRQDEISRTLPHFVFRLPITSKVCKLLGTPSTWFLKLRLIAANLSMSKTDAGEALVMLQLVEDELALRKEHVDWCIAEGTEEKEFIKSLTTEAAKVKHEVSGKEEEPEASSGIRSTTLVISKADLAAVLNSAHFLTASSTVARLCSPAGATAVPDEESRVNQIFEAISGPGLLIAWQCLLRHHKLRSSHEMLNLLTTVRGSLCRRVAYCQVVGGNKKRKGFAQTYVWSSELHALYVSGRGSTVQWYTKGYLVALMHIQKADEVDTALGDMDFMVDGDHFLGMKDFMHRTLLGYGHAPVPAFGMSVAAFFDLLGEVRDAALQAPLHQQPDMLELLISFFKGALEEHDVYLLDQLDEVAPASRRLEGFLPPSSESGGVVHQLREALSGQLEIDTFRRKAPHLFKDAHRVVGRFVTGSPLKRLKSGGEDGEPIGKDKDGEKEPKKDRAIGALRNKVKWLDTENRFYAITKSVVGDLKELADEVGVDFDKRCWPVMCSLKAENDRCELCPTPDLHKSRKTGMHKPVKLPKGWQKKYLHAREDFRLPAGATALP